VLTETMIRMRADVFEKRERCGALSDLAWDQGASILAGAHRPFCWRSARSRLILSPQQGATIRTPVGL